MAGAERRAPLGRILPAAAVHALTASGGVVGALALVAIARGDLRAAALWMLVALVIDSVDGSLARAVRVREVLPQIDGRRLDDIVDFLNYVVVPAVFMVEAASLPGPAWAALPILASAYGFSQEDAKTPDDFFLGFPSYWNAVAIYLWLFGLSAGIGAAVVAVLALFVFVPLKYIYASRVRVWRQVAVGGAAAWTVALAVAVAWPEQAGRWRVAELSLIYPAWYVAASLTLGGWHRRQS